MHAMGGFGVMLFEASNSEFSIQLDWPGVNAVRISVPEILGKAFSHGNGKSPSTFCV